MGHNLATDIVTMILIIAGTTAVTVPITIGFVLQFQKNKDKIYAKLFGVFHKE
jgi:hypothetical protein